MSLLSLVRQESLKDDLKVLIVCFAIDKNKINDVTKSYFMFSIGYVPKSYDYIGYSSSMLNNKIFEEEGGLESSVLMDRVNEVPYSYDYIIYEHCPIFLEEDERNELIFNKKSISTFSNKLSHNGKIVFVTGKVKFDYLVIFFIEYGFTFNTLEDMTDDPILASKIIEFRKIEVKKEDLKVLIVCFETKRNILNDVSNRYFMLSIGYVPQQYDYIGRKYSKLNGETINQKGGTKSVSVIDKVKTVPYNYDFIIYEHCPLPPKNITSIVLDERSVSILANKLTQNGRIVFVGGRSKSDSLTGVFKPYGFSFSTLDGKTKDEEMLYKIIEFYRA